MKPIQYHPLASNLECSFIFSRGGGNICYDATGNMNDGEGTNLVWGRDGLDLSGENEHIIIPNFIRQDDDEWTIFMTFIQDIRNPGGQSDASHLVAQQNGTGTGRSWLRIEDQYSSTNRLNSFIGGSGHDANTVVSLGIPHSAALTKIGTAFNFYLDGKNDGSFIAIAEPADGDIILFDHKNAAGNGCFDGTLGVYHAFSRRLHDNEINWLDADPIGMYELDFNPSTIHEKQISITNDGALLLMAMT